MVAAHRVAVLGEQGWVEEATDELVWIWEHALEVGTHWVGVRHSYVVDEIRDLVAAHPSARAKFTEIRDRNEQRLSQANALRDWLDLNRALGDEMQTLKWIDRVKSNPPAELNVCDELTLLDLLVRSERWAELGLLIRDPIAEVERDHQRMMQLCAHMDSEPNPVMSKMMRTCFLTRVICIHYALRAAARTEEATATALRAKELEPGPEMARQLASPEPPKQLIER
jgi:hypothetical protein